MTIRTRGHPTRYVAIAMLVAALGSSLGGCALGPQIVHAEVTAFNQWSALPADRTYAFARTLEYQNSLELTSYEDVVRDELALQGFTLSSDEARTDLVVTLRPAVSSTRVRVRDPWPVDPFWPAYGFYGRGGFRTFGWYDPLWGPYNDFNDYSVDVFHRRLELDIDSRSPGGKRYYEGRVESSGRTESPTAVMPAMIRALFADFPGNNGQTRRVDVPVVRQ